TNLQGDWSSDVYSSDLDNVLTLVGLTPHPPPEDLDHLVHRLIGAILLVVLLAGLHNLGAAVREGNLAEELPLTIRHREIVAGAKIGRASCRERCACVYA